jgi:hypothetical protein
MNQTMLQAYNCDRQKPGQKKDNMPAEKQLYRPDYVLHHFIHYSTITVMSEMNRQDVEKLGRKWNSHNAFPDPLSRFANEQNEGKIYYGIRPERNQVEARHETMMQPNQQQTILIPCLSSAT